MAASEPLKVHRSSSDLNFPRMHLNQGDVAPSSSQPPATISSIVPAKEHNASATPSATRVPELLMHKNRLQEYTQRSNIPLPMYQTINEGSDHAPRFRSTVWVDGMKYTSHFTFSHRKAAEQDAARIAWESLSEKIKDEGCPFVFENILFSKSILNEYATKMNLEMPTYNTVRLEGVLPLFVSTLVFNGTSYTGGTAKSKKEAAQLAARAVILSIMGNSDSGKLSEIINSKSKIYAAFKPNNSQCIDAGTLSAVANTGHTSVTLDHKDKEVAGLVASSSCQELHMHKQEPLPQASQPPNMSLQPSSEHHHICDASSSKKRRKNKKKANKKSRLESPSPIAAFPLNEVPPCPVAQ